MVDDEEPFAAVVVVGILIDMSVLQVRRASNVDADKIISFEYVIAARDRDFHRVNLGAKQRVGDTPYLRAVTR